MFNTLREAYYVAWSDLRFMRHNILNVVVMSLMSPILYLVAFGYGLGVQSAWWSGKNPHQRSFKGCTDPPPA